MVRTLMISLAALACCAASAGDWHWTGPLGTYLPTNALSLHGSAVYAASLTNGVFGADVETGATAWTIPPPPGVSSFNAQSTFVPGTRMDFVAPVGGALIARINGTSNTVMWSTDLEASSHPDLRLCTFSPVSIYDGLVVGICQQNVTISFAPTKKTLFALCLHTGALQWAKPLGKPSLTHPLALQGRSGTVVVPTGDGSVVTGVNASTGRSLWTFPLPQGLTASVTVCGRTVLAFAGGTVTGLSLQGRPLWVATLSAATIGDPVCLAPDAAAGQASVLALTWGGVPHLHRVTLKTGTVLFSTAIAPAQSYGQPMLLGHSLSVDQKNGRAVVLFGGAATATAAASLAVSCISIATGAVSTIARVPGVPVVSVLSGVVVLPALSGNKTAVFFATRGGSMYRRTVG